MASVVATIVEARPWDPAAEAETVLRWTDHSLTARVGGVAWLRRIEVSLTQTMSLGGEDGRGQLGAGEISLALLDGDDTVFLGYFWDGRKITVREIDIDENDPASIAAASELANYETVFDGVIDADPEVEPGRLRLRLRDFSRLLQQPVLTARYAGTGGLEGPAELAGRLKPRVLFGSVENLEPPIIWGRPEGPWIAQIDGVEGVSAVTAAYDRAVTRPLHATDFADFAALQAAVQAGSGGALGELEVGVSLADGLVGGWGRLFGGFVTVDCTGLAGGTVIETVGSAVKWLIEGPGGRPGAVLQAGVDALEATATETIGVAIPTPELSAEITVAELAKRLLASIGGYMMDTPLGQVALGLRGVAGPADASVSEARLAGWRRLPPPTPVWRRSAPYRLIGRVQTGDEIATIGALAAVDAADFATQVSGAEKPDDNADVTGANTAANTMAVGDMAAVVVEQRAEQIFTAFDASTNLRPGIQILREGGGGLARFANGLTFGAGIDGDSFLFPEPVDEIPRLRYLGGGASTPDPNGAVTWPWSTRVRAVNATTSGFELSAKFVAQQSMPVLQSDSGAVSDGTGLVTDKSIATEAEDDAYTCFFSGTVGLATEYCVTIPPELGGGGESCTTQDGSATFVVDTRATAGAAWIERSGAKVFTNSSTSADKSVSGSITVTVDGLGSDAAFRVRMKSGSLGSSLDGFSKVEYHIPGATQDIVETMSPAGADLIEIEVLNGEQPEPLQ